MPWRTKAEGVNRCEKCWEQQIAIQVFPSVFSFFIFLEMLTRSPGPSYLEQFRDETPTYPKPVIPSSNAAAASIDKAAIQDMVEVHVAVITGLASLIPPDNIVTPFLVDQWTRLHADFARQVWLTCLSTSGFEDWSPKSILRAASLPALQKASILNEAHETVQLDKVRAENRALQQKLRESEKQYHESQRNYDALHRTFLSFQESTSAKMTEEREAAARVAQDSRRQADEIRRLAEYSRALRREIDSLKVSDRSWTRIDDDDAAESNLQTTLSAAYRTVVMEHQMRPATAKTPRSLPDETTRTEAAKQQRPATSSGAGKPVSVLFGDATRRRKAIEAVLAISDSANDETDVDLAATFVLPQHAFFRGVSGPPSRRMSVLGGNPPSPKSVTTPHAALARRTSLAVTAASASSPRKLSVRLGANALEVSMRPQTAPTRPRGFVAGWRSIAPSNKQMQDIYAKLGGNGDGSGALDKATLRQFLASTYEDFGDPKHWDRILTKFPIVRYDELCVLLLQVSRL